VQPALRAVPPAPFALPPAPCAVQPAVLQRERKRGGGPVPDGQRWSLVVAMILGALVSAKLVHWTNGIPHVLTLVITSI